METLPKQQALLQPLLQRIPLPLEIRQQQQVLLQPFLHFIQLLLQQHLIQLLLQQHLILQCLLFIEAHQEALLLRQIERLFLRLALPHLILLFTAR